jgi:hypothetical protein
MSTADCLVFKIEDDKLNIYIIYDSLRKRYGIWGKGKTLNTDYPGFYYNCELPKQLYLFIDFIIDDVIDVTLYNFPDLPNGCSEITFELLEELESNDKIITQYEEVEYDEEYIVNTLNMLIFIKNEYYL